MSLLQLPETLQNIVHGLVIHFVELLEVGLRLELSGSKTLVPGTVVGVDRRPQATGARFRHRSQLIGRVRLDSWKLSRQL